MPQTEKEQVFYEMRNLLFDLSPRINFWAETDRVNGEHAIAFGKENRAKQIDDLLEKAKGL